MDVVSIPDSEFVELLGIELPRVQRIARLLIGNADVADDVVAEAVARTLPRWRAGGIDDYSAYLRRVVVNLAAQRWHRRALALRRDHFALDWLSRPTDVETTVADTHTTWRVDRPPVLDPNAITETGRAGVLNDGAWYRSTSSTNTDGAFIALLTPLGPNRFYRLGNEWQLAGFDASQLFFLRTTRQGLNIGVLADLAPSN